MATMNAPTMDRRTSPERRTALREGRGSLMTGIDYFVMFLLIIGGLNWALIGLFEVDMVATVFGPLTPAARLVYVLVGLGALYALYLTAKMAGAKRR